MEIDAHRSRLLELADAHQVSLSRLSQMLGKNPSYLQQFVRKGSPRKLEEGDRGMLARFFGVDEYELGKVQDNSYTKSKQSGSAPWIDIPRLAVGASAGPGAEPDGELVFDSIRFSWRWLRAMGLQPDRLSTIVVAGDSMEPTLRHGDEILVDRVPRTWRDGIHVVRLGDSLLVKRLDTSRPGTLMLISDNPAYPPVEIAAADVEVIGRVVWKGGRI
ncbi:S24 family peptidase [Novosphingobium sp. Leaf2]|uniref:S24 family peptidase n=1 Tax=Novosphingobium sp. Leaf2 TaxID=1735670 RepID=UPI0006FFA688|nr:S24 family peptidase [Novosphingobium sp. Leaf2]KQM13103.1 transcriptional regulator [Novosphingobium sp. Leaf2]